MKPKYKKQKPRKTGFFCVNCGKAFNEVDFSIQILFGQEKCLNCVPKVNFEQ